VLFGVFVQQLADHPLAKVECLGVIGQHYGAEVITFPMRAAGQSR
jgi:hypothetical protein